MLYNFIFYLELWPLDLDHVYKYHQEPIIGSWNIVETRFHFYFIACLTFTFDCVTLTMGQLQHLIDINHVWKYYQYPIIGSWHKVTKSFYKLAYLASNFHLVTLTRSQRQHRISINHVFKYHQYQNIGSWSTVETFFTNLHIWPWPMTLRPWI